MENWDAPMVVVPKYLIVFHGLEYAVGEVGEEPALLPWILINKLSVDVCVLEERPPERVGIISN